MKLRRSCVGSSVAVFLMACGGSDSGPTEPPGTEPAEIPAGAAAWLDARAVPFSGTSLALPHDDLEPLRDMVGDARIVSLGENTHGTRDFFEMKARVLRFLVEEMGFDAFAIEATWPESYALDDYVRTGVGDPAEGLAGLFFWTWQTQAVLEMVEWMRDHNAAGGDVGFYGFDMQYPGLALVRFREFIEEHDPARSDEVRAEVQCLQSRANNEDGLFQSGLFANLPGNTQSECAGGLAMLQADFASRRDAYVAASSQAEYDFAAQSLRVARQYVEMVMGAQHRDASMAENASWLLHQLGPDAKIVLWAHNFHVATAPGRMGQPLRDEFGDDMLVVGFTHSAGEFTGVIGDGRTFFGLQRRSLDAREDFSYEHYFSSSAHPRFILDMRGLDASGADAAWLVGPRASRAIGCCWIIGQRHWSSARLPELYDVNIHVQTTRPSVLINGLGG